jgi:hypothetical protein
LTENEANREIRALFEIFSVLNQASLDLKLSTDFGLGNKKSPNGNCTCFYAP